MIYSVYDYHNKNYKYYEAPAELPAAGWFRQPIGSVPVPEAISEPLPPGARYIGEGDVAKGVLAHTTGELGTFVQVPSWVWKVAVLGVVFMAGRYSK